MKRIRKILVCKSCGFQKGRKKQEPIELGGGPGEGGCSRFAYGCLVGGIIGFALKVQGLMRMIAGAATSRRPVAIETKVYCPQCGKVMEEMDESEAPPPPDQISH